MDGSRDATSDAVSNFLAHYGVKGMRWGRRKNKPPATSEASRSTAIRAKAKTGKVKALTNAELRESIERMRLEQEFKRLTGNEKSQVGKFIGNTLLNVGKQQLGMYLNAQIPGAGTAAKKLITAATTTKKQRHIAQEWEELVTKPTREWEEMNRRQRAKHINTPEAWGGGS